MTRRPALPASAPPVPIATASFGCCASSTDAPAPNIGPCDALAAAGFTSTSSARRPSLLRPRNSKALSRECTRDGASRLVLNLAQVFLAAKTLRIDLVDVLGARGARRKPAVIGYDLDAAKRLTVARRRCERRRDLLAAQFLDRKLFARQ